MKIIDVFRQRIVLFIIQILLLNVFIYISGYKFTINFDDTTLKEQKLIIQFLANFILFDDLPGFFFICLSWLLASTIPIFIFTNFKKAYSMNLLTLFFPSYFLYVFLRRHSRTYFDSKFHFLILQTIILGIVIVGFSIGLSLILKKFTKFKTEPQIEDLFIMASMNKIVCPNCGTEFDSTPKFCYNCNTDLTMLINNESGKEE